MNETRDDKEKGAFRIQKSPFPRRITRLRLVGVFLGIAFFTFAFFWLLPVRVDDIESWETLEQQLHAELVIDKALNGIELEHFQDSSVYRRLKNWGDEELWFAMLRNENRKHAFVTLAGFYCISENRPSKAKQAALVALTNGWVHSSFFTTPLLRELKKENYSKHDLDALNEFMLADIKPETAALAICSIPVATIREWFHRKGSSRVPTQSFLYAIGELIDADPPASERRILDELILELSKTPGYPRRFYVLYGDEKTDYYQRSMKQVIGDDTFTRRDMSFLFYCKENYIKNNYDTVMADASAARIKQFDEMVNRHKLNDERIQNDSQQVD